MMNQPVYYAGSYCDLTKHYRLKIMNSKYSGNQTAFTKTRLHCMIMFTVSIHYTSHGLYSSIFRVT